MESNKLFTKSFKNFIRFVSLFALSVVIFRVIELFVFNCTFYNHSDKNCFISDTAMFFIYLIDAFVLILLIFTPTKFILFGIISIIHSITILIDQTENNIGILLFYTGILVLALTGFFQKKGKIKTIIFTLLFQILIFSEIRFGKQSFLLSIYSKLIIFFIINLILFFSVQLCLDKLILTYNKVIDISTFPDLTIRDAEWIELILRETKYETIARKYNLSEGTVKNNFAKIFRILNVSDRIHFLSVYGGCKVIYGNTKHIKVSTFLRDVYWTK